MKLSIFQKKKSDIPIHVKNHLSPYAQTSGSKLFLNKLSNKRRGSKGTGALLRKHHGIYKKAVLTIIFLASLVFLIIKFNLLSYFIVKNVEVDGASKFVSLQDLKALTEKNVVGESIFFLNSQRLETILGKNFLGSKAIDVEKKYPNKIKVVVEERVPVAIVYTDKEENFLIDSEGYVLGVVDNNYPGLPRIKYEGAIKVGDFLEKGIIPVSIEILQFADSEKLKVSSMSFYDKYSRIYVNDGIEVYLAYGKNVEDSLKTVSTLIKKMITDSKIIKKIDLRFDKVIVLYD